MKCLPRWTSLHEALSHVNAALLLLIERGEYGLVRQLGSSAQELQGRIAEGAP